MKRFAMLIAALTIAGCENGGVENSNAPTARVPGEIANVSGDGGSAGVYRVQDSERGVTCYVAVGYRKAGIDCLKDKESTP